MFKPIFIALSIAVFMVIVNASASAQLCEPGGFVATATPCQETKAGIITISSSGEYETSMGSGPEKTWQFRLRTWAPWIDPNTGQGFFVTRISIDNKTLNCGEDATYTQSVNYDSSLFPDGSYDSNGSIEARDYNNPGSWAPLGIKSCQYIVDNP